MVRKYGWIGCAVLAVFVLLVSTGRADAARGRFHYVPADSNGSMVWKPGPYGTPGERITVRGVFPDTSPPRPTCINTYRHPYTGLMVRVPLALPEDTPMIYHRGYRIMYNYGSYSVEVHFLPDGSVDVIYANGLFRSL